MIATRFLSKAAVALVIGGVAGGAIAGGFSVASAVSGSSAATGSGSVSESDLAAMADPATMSHLVGTSGTASDTTSVATDAGPGRRGRLAHRIEHGEFVVKGKDGKPVDLVVQRGEVTAVSATSITLRSADGFTASYPIASTTKVWVNHSRQTIEQVKVGDKAGVLAKKDNGTLVTAMVIVRS
ncbi:MAG: hypothetical protein HYR62_09645 [Actinobacteria bacterium]|nr:hypothetical protein [Actinomycetota bacterium]MBI3687982.1 hypothetical protein [Actinomycetota bacterium]